jgi:hypothetical protein
MTTPMIDEARVAEKAYELWLAEGQPDGKSDEHWFRAIDSLTVPVAKKPNRTASSKAAAPEGETAPKARAPRKAKADA